MDVDESDEDVHRGGEYWRISADIGEYRWISAHIRHNCNISGGDDRR